MKKKIHLSMLLLLVAMGCKNDAVQKPKHLIGKEKMIAIMYDITLLDALRFQNISNPQKTEINANLYILKKYKIDSLQFAKSNAFYATNYTEYKEMFEEVNNRLMKNKIAIDSLIKLKKKRVKKSSPISKK